jgi:hypothetical protein
MKLPNRIDFNFATLDEVTLQPNEDGGKAVLCISTPLTPELAENLRIREQFFDGKGLAREFTGAVGLPNEQTDVDVKLSGDGSELLLNPEKLRAFKVQHDSTEDGAVQLLLKFRVHISTVDGIEQCYGFAREVNKDCFKCVLVSKQGELFTDAEIREKDTRFSCQHCDADVPLNSDGTAHITGDGEIVSCTHPSAIAAAAKGAVASQADMDRIQGAATNAVQEIRKAKARPRATA